jgi:glycosyltransferase involved in cell wall biosynthesis
MIVKNESKIIRRMLETIIPLIDCYCICDTGSTDDTRDVITAFFQEKNIPGKIVEEPFVNFSQARNAALRACEGMSDYILLMDADMKLEIRSFQKDSLTKNAYSVYQGHEGFYYKNTRIVKNNGAFLYRGVTHEYLDTSNIEIIDKSQLFIRDVGDGGCKANKFERDVALLRQGIVDEPNNVRYYFYLAKSLHPLGQFTEAIEMYTQRIAMGGWNQEVWYSHYQIGHCYRRLNRMAEAVQSWMNAFEVMPERIENLYEIVRHYRVIGKCKLAKVFYDLAMAQKPNKEDFLFLHNDVYTYKLAYEYTIIASYVKIPQVNDAFVTVLNHSDEFASNCLSNMKFYKNRLDHLSEVDFSFSIKHTIAGKERTFYSSSASILPYGDGYLMNVRLVNYYINDRGKYLNCEDYIITMNQRIELTKQLEIKSSTLMEPAFVEQRYLGIEDMKLFDAGEILYLGTGLQSNGKLGMITGVYGETAQELTCGFNQSYCEKNWVFVMCDTPHIVYQWHPLQLCKIEDTLELVRTIPTPRLFKHVRGSTCASRYKEEQWFVLHMVSYEEPRHYYHLIAVFDVEMKLLRYSAPFKFEGICIEYCLGLVVEEHRVLITHSGWDRTTKVRVYDRSYIESMLKY